MQQSEEMRVPATGGGEEDLRRKLIAHSETHQAKVPPLTVNSLHSATRTRVWMQSRLWILFHPGKPVHLGYKPESIPDHEDDIKFRAKVVLSSCCAAWHSYLPFAA